MKPIHWILILTLLIILNIILFSILYWRSDTNEYDFEKGLYLSVQIQTLVGYSNFTENDTVRRLVTIQSLIAYLLNIITVIFLGLWIGEIFYRNNPIKN